MPLQVVPRSAVTSGVILASPITFFRAGHALKGKFNPTHPQGFYPNSWGADSALDRAVTPWAKMKPGLTSSLGSKHPNTSHPSRGQCPVYSQERDS